MQIENYIKSISKRLKKPLVIFDTETTSIDKQNNEIIQFTAIRIEPDGSFKNLNFICNPKGPINPMATKVHGFTKEKVKDKPSFKKYATKVIDFFKDATISGYNVNFDIEVLKNELKNAGIEWDASNSYCAYKVYLKDSGRKLKDAVKFYINEEMQNAHDSDFDVDYTIAVISKQLENRNSDIESVIQSVEEENKKEEKQYIIEKNGDKVVNFGKFIGTPIKKLDKNYLNWIVNKADKIPEKVKSEFKKYINTV